MPERNTPPPPQAEMPARVAELDWSRTPLGPRAQWPGSLRALTDMLLAHPTAMIVLWGPELVQIYNDSYRLVMGSKHPGGLGQPTRECWPEVWLFNAPLYEGVLERGETFEFEDQPLTIHRYGQDEQAFFNLSYSPLRDEGEVAGVLVTVIETTERVRSRHELQAQYVERGAQARSLQIIEEFTRDLTVEKNVSLLIRRVQDLLTEYLPGSVTQYFGADGQGADWQSGVTADRPSEPSSPHGSDPHGSETALPISARVRLPLMVGGQERGLFEFSQAGQSRWSALSLSVMRATVRSLGLAIERTEYAAQLQQRTAALDAFAAFTEAVGSDPDVFSLARQASALLRATFADPSVGYYGRGGDLWTLRVWSEDLSQDVVDVLLAGLPLDTPMFAGVVQAREAVFTNAWNAGREQIPLTERYGAVGNYPLVLANEVCGVLSVGLKDVQAWSERDQAIVRAVGRGLNLALERAEQTRQLAEHNIELDARTKALEYFAELARSQESDPPTLIMRAQQAVADLIGEGFAVYYELEGDAWRLKSQVGSPDDDVIQASLDSALPYTTVQNFRLPWETGTPFYQDIYDPALDQHVPGTMALATTATLPLVVGARQQGIFGYGLKVSRPWTQADKATLATAVTSLGLALERAEQLRRFEEERAALDAFARFTEASTQITDVLALAHQAKDVLGATLDVEVGYSELEDGLWKGRVFSAGTPADVVAQSKRGFPADLPSFARPFEAQDVVFVDGWDASVEGDEQTGVYTAAALYPYVKAGRPHGLLTMGSPHARAWTERERSVFVAVARSLELAFKRAEQTARLAAQNAELEARTRALEGFAELARDLAFETDRFTLVRRAQEIVLDLMPPGYAVYYEADHDRWRLKSQVGDLRNDALQAVVDAGLPYDAPSLLTPLLTRQACYQDVYAQGTDTPAEVVQHISAVATLPLLVQGQPVGVFGVGLFEEWVWTPIDKVVLETVLHHLSLALERAEGVAQLAQRTRELERSNAELEQFAYVASHDLQEPLRSVTSFSQLLAAKVADPNDEKTQRYVRYINEGTGRMAQLIQDLLAFSKVATQAAAFKPTRTRLLVAQVQQDLRDQIERTGTQLQWGELPDVLGDATQLRQLFQNLIGNAIKFRDPERGPQVNIEAAPEGQRIRFLVSDNGKGIDPQYFERIFVIFQRLHNRDRYEGNGMGLSIVKKIVERHGGQITLTSALGEGTTFSFTLPAVPVER